ncbi:MAG: hypothetical protein OEW09_19115 [Anaerolineae bacterium]|nr:hypothetical protein [Anaerolineae bacterium]
MSEQPTSPKPSSTEQILDLLLDALLERQAARQAQGKPGLGRVIPPSPPAPKPVTTPFPAPQPTAEPSTTEPAAEKPAVEARRLSPKPLAPGPIPAAKPAREPRPGEESWTPPQPLPSINLGRTLGRLLLVLVVLAVLINVPINRYGTSLARIMPDTHALVIRDGLVLKGSGAEIYVLEDNKLRWISSLEAFEFFGYSWEQVHVVDDSFLEQFEKGRPIHVLLKCERSPHIYALENGQKRWIKDIPTFQAEGYVWEDVKFVSCDYLRSLPDGPPIPEDAGPPPQP